MEEARPPAPAVEGRPAPGRGLHDVVIGDAGTPQGRITDVLSSPYVRCVQTVEPLADRIGLTVEIADALAEGARLDDALPIVEKYADTNAVLCMHGDVLPELLEHFARRGLRLPHDRVEKGSTWALDFDDGTVTAIRYFAPADVRPEPVNVFVTNDDGVGTPGIRVLAAALAAAGHDVLVVAPADDRSGSGAAIGKLYRDRPLPVVDHEWDDLPDIVVRSIDAPPATAVLAACLGAFGDVPDVVVAGINPGANTGHLVIHSGTVGAALTAAGLDVPAIAVSTRWSTTNEYHWETAARLRRRRGRLGRAARRRTPASSTSTCPTCRSPRSSASRRPSSRRTARCGSHLPTRRRATSSSTSRAAPTQHRAPTSAAVASGYVSVTPLRSVVRAASTGAADAVSAALA